MDQKRGKNKKKDNIERNIERKWAEKTNKDQYNALHPSSPHWEKLWLNIYIYLLEAVIYLKSEWDYQTEQSASTEIQMGAIAKSYMRKGFLINEEMRKYLVIYEEAVSHIWLCNRSLLDCLIYEENFVFFFISVGSSAVGKLRDKEEWVLK